MKRPESDILEAAKEKVTSSYREELSGHGGMMYPETREYRIARNVVGFRYYNAAGVLIKETPMRNRKKHGREYSWDDDGFLVSMEPYREGLCHGTAKQYDRSGQVIGTYRMVHGTGYDLWRCKSFDGSSYFVWEIQSNRNGVLHGFEWWLNEDQESVYKERHWNQGKQHGIERDWNFKGKLRRGYPKYRIHDRAVTNRQYIAAARKDPTLPPFRLKDNSPKREFSPEIRRLLNVPKRKRGRRAKT